MRINIEDIIETFGLRFAIFMKDIWAVSNDILALGNWQALGELVVAALEGQEESARLGG